MYKLREERLRNFYTGDMDAGIGMSKSPMIPSHGDSLADQSFQSFKAKEIRDCESPTRHIQYDMVTPDTSGWNVITTSQVSTDGKEQRNTTLATTDAVKDIHGGKTSFSGKNEQIESHRHDGDDKNFTTTSGHASNTVLKEHTVVGDANNGRTESTSNTTSSSSKRITSSNYQSDNIASDDFVQEFEGVLNSAKRLVRENTNKSNAENEQFERIPCNDFDKEYFNSKTTNKSSSNKQSTYEIRRNSASSTTSSVDAKKIQRETEYLANAPGQLISRSVEYPDANTKVVTETKTLPDGSTVTTTKYETRAASSTTTSKSSKQEKSSTSRVVTEDRAERNRIEIIAGDNKNVVDEVVKSRRVVDGDNKEQLKPESNETVIEKTVKQEFHRNENVCKDDIRNETYNKEATRKENVSEDRFRQEEIQTPKQPVQESSQYKTRHEKVFNEKVDEFQSSRDSLVKQPDENINNRVEVSIYTDQRRDSNKQDTKIKSNMEEVHDNYTSEKHRTVKKDLSRDEHHKKTQTYEHESPDDQFERLPVQEEVIVPKKQIYHVCSPSHDHSSKPEPRTDYTSKRISVDHNPTHEAFARSLRCVTPETDKRSVQSSTHSVKTNYTYNDHGRRSPSRDTNVSDTSKFSSTTVTKSTKTQRNSNETSHSPYRKSSPEKRTPTMTSAISSETIDLTSENLQKNSKKVESTTRKSSQSYISNKPTSNLKTEDHYDHPRNNQPIHVKSSDYDIPKNNSPVQSSDIPNRKSSTGQPSYLRPTASSTRHNTKPNDDDDTVSKPKKQQKDNDEPIYETISDRPANDRRQPSRIDSQTTYTSSVTRETKDYRNAEKSLKKQSATLQPDYEPNFDSGRSNSPTSSVSDIEYVNFRKVTDLDEIETLTNQKATSQKVQERNINEDTHDGLFLSTHKKKAKSPSLESDSDTIVHDDQPKEPFYLNNDQKETISKNSDKVNETQKPRHPLTRSETYEERCRSMLGMKPEHFPEEPKTTKQASIDLIRSEQNVETFRTSPSSPTKSPDRKNVTEKNVERSPSRSPERKPKTSARSTVEKYEKYTAFDEDHRSDTYPRSKGNKAPSPKRTPHSSPERNETVESKKVVSDATTVNRKNSKTYSTSTVVKHETNTVDEDHRFDTFPRSKGNKSPSPKRTPHSSPERIDNVESKKVVSDAKTFNRKDSKTSTKSTIVKHEVSTAIDEDNRFDTYPRSKSNKSPSPKRTPHSSPERKDKVESKKVVSDATTFNRKDSKTSLKSTVIKHENVDKDTRFDTTPSSKNNKSPSPKRTPHSSPERNEKLEPKRVVTEATTVNRKSSKIIDQTTSSDRSKNSSPERKEKPSDSLPETTKKFIKEETRSSSFTTRTTRAKEYVIEDTKVTPQKTTPKREPTSKTKSTDSPPKKSPNRSPSTSPIRKSREPSTIAERTKKFLNSENEVKRVTRKNSKSEVSQTSQGYRTTNDKRVNETTELDQEIKTTQKTKSQNKGNKEVKELSKSPTRIDRSSPCKFDETFVETSDTFFSETKTDTIKRRPIPENKGPVRKSNATSPDRNLSKPTTYSHKPSEDNKTSPKKISTRTSSITVSTDNHDLNDMTSNITFTLKKHSTEPSSSPVKTKGKLNSVPDSKINSAPLKMKIKPTKTDVKSKSKPKQNNNYSTDDESNDEMDTPKSARKIPITERKDSAPVYRSTKVDKDVKMARSTSEHFSGSPRKGSKPEIETPKSPQKFEKRPTKCVTTKTINLSTTNTLNSEDMENVIIDIQLAKSSREPTPNRIIPTPVSPEEDTGKPRYPDTVHEPDDERPQRRPNIKNIPIFEEESKEFISCHITEVNEEYDGADSDECMMSVSDKVTKFSSKVASPTNDKFKRTIVETVNEFSDDDDVDDECRLSVQGKVTKFTAIAEEVSTTKSSKNTKKECNTSTKVNEKVAQFTAKENVNVKTSKPFKPEPIKKTDLIDDDSLLTINEKVTKFSSVADTITKPVKKTERVTIRREFEDIDESLKSDECLLSVSDKVNKFVATADALTSTVPQVSAVKSPELVAKIQRQVSRRDNVPKMTETDQQIPSDQNDFGLEPYADNQKSTPKGKVTDRYVPNKTKPTSTTSAPISLQSIDVVKKAKTIFEKENSPKAPKQRDILNRPSIWEQRRAEAAKADVKLTDIGVFKTGDNSKENSPVPRHSSRTPDQERSSRVSEHTSSKTDIFERRVTPSRDVEAEPKKQPQQNVSERSLSTERMSATKRKPSEECTSPDSKDDRYDKHSYMNHTISSLEHIRRDSIEINKSNIRKSTQDDVVDQVEINPRSSVKFGVELKRTNSQQSQPSRRKSSSSEIPHVEEIFELGLLERMLDTVVGYEQRRRIRAQIRLVKKQIQEEEKEKLLKKARNRTEVTTESFVRKQEPSPVRKSSPIRKQYENTNEHTSKYSQSFKVDRTTSPVRKSSPIRKHSPNRQQIDEDAEFIVSQHTTTKEETSVRRSSPNRKNFIDGNSNTYRNKQMNNNIQKSRSPSPKSNKISISSNVKRSEVKQTNNSKSADDDKPIWATRNILTKASDSTRTFTSSGAKKTTVTKVQKQKTVEQNDDCVTSSYGIGPTDEDGTPLFGIRALKKKSPAVQTSKVSGTIVQETLYSDNGAPPVGSRTTTMYSSDPQDIRHFVETNGTASEIRDRLIERGNNRRGITSVTTSQKIESNDTSEDAVMSISGNKQAKVLRRGSVKELSEKFQKETSKSSEKTTSSYPKAGLILRTQTSRESTPGANSSLRSGSADFDDCDIEVRCSSSRLQSDDEIEYKQSTSRQQQTRSFLNSNTKVTDVQDVLSRMRNADNVIEDGDTEDDKEARALLNKFLGASVLMSGMESMVPREITTIVGKPTSQKQVTTTHVTKTIKSTSSPSTTREIKIRDIDSIWDETLLKQLLDQSSSYEERRKLRARLRQVMAEKEESKVQVKSDESSKTVTTTQSITNARTVSTTKAAPAKPISPFAKFRQLDKQVSTQSSPKTFK